MSNLPRCCTYFRTHKFGCTTECAGGAAVPHVLFAKTVISNFDMTIQCQQDVVKLQITVDDSVLVEVLQSQADFRGIEPRVVSSQNAERGCGIVQTYCARFSPN